MACRPGADVINPCGFWNALVAELAFDFDVWRQAGKTTYRLRDQEPCFWRPSGITALSNRRVLVVDSCRHRVQVYRPAAARSHGPAA